MASFASLTVNVLAGISLASVAACPDQTGVKSLLPCCSALARKGHRPTHREWEIWQGVRERAHLDSEAIYQGTRGFSGEHVGEYGCVSARMPQGITVPGRCRGFRAQEKGGADLCSGRPERKRGGNSAPIGDPASGYDRHADGIDDLRNERQGAGLRGHRPVAVGSEEGPPMPACFISLRNDGIDATSFQPERF